MVFTIDKMSGGITVVKKMCLIVIKNAQCKKERERENLNGHNNSQNINLFFGGVKHDTL